MCWLSYGFVNLPGERRTSLFFNDTCAQRLAKTCPYLCPCLEMCYLRSRYAEQLADFTGADTISIGDTGAFYQVIS